MDAGAAVCNAACASDGVSVRVGSLRHLGIAQSGSASYSTDRLCYSRCLFYMDRRVYRDVVIRRLGSRIIIRAAGDFRRPTNGDWHFPGYTSPAAGSYVGAIPFRAEPRN